MIPVDDISPLPAPTSSRIVRRKKRPIRDSNRESREKREHEDARKKRSRVDELV